MKQMNRGISRPATFTARTGIGKPEKGPSPDRSASSHSPNTRLGPAQSKESRPADTTHRAATCSPHTRSLDQVGFATTSEAKRRSIESISARIPQRIAPENRSKASAASPTGPTRRSNSPIRPILRTRPQQTAPPIGGIHRPFAETTAAHPARVSPGRFRRPNARI